MVFDKVGPVKLFAFVRSSAEFGCKPTYSEPPTPPLQQKTLKRRFDSRPKNDVPALNHAMWCNKLRGTAAKRAPVCKKPLHAAVFSTTTQEPLIYVSE
jgi:hypothetical protein